MRLHPLKRKRSPRRRLRPGRGKAGISDLVKPNQAGTILKPVRAKAVVMVG
jgi:hypothetical protein